MDRMIYVAMSGAKQALGQQATVAHNLANLTTNGFRAETSVFRAVPVVGEGAPTRAFVVDSTPGADFTPGVIQTTGRDLDIAVQGKGWIAVQAADGSEAYTRNGSLQLNANGVLQTRNGNAVLGDGGPLSIPSDTLITIAGDGTVSTVPTGNRPSAASSSSTRRRVRSSAVTMDCFACATGPRRRRMQKYAWSQARLKRATSTRWMRWSA